MLKRCLIFVLFLSSLELLVPNTALAQATPGAPALMSAPAESRPTETEAARQQWVDRTMEKFLHSEEPIVPSEGR